MRVKHLQNNIEFSKTTDHYKTSAEFANNCGSPSRNRMSGYYRQEYGLCQYYVSTGSFGVSFLGSYEGFSTFLLRLYKAQTTSFFIGVKSGELQFDLPKIGIYG